MTIQLSTSPRLGFEQVPLEEALDNYRSCRTKWYRSLGRVVSGQKTYRMDDLPLDAKKAFSTYKNATEYIHTLIKDELVGSEVEISASSSHRFNFWQEENGLQYSNLLETREYSSGPPGMPLKGVLSILGSEWDQSQGPEYAEVRLGNGTGNIVDIHGGPVKASGWIVPLAGISSLKIV